MKANAASLSLRWLPKNDPGLGSVVQIDEEGPMPTHHTRENRRGKSKFISWAE